jgi:polyhydroxyalkanoate synthesis regulator phasin
MQEAMRTYLELALGLTEASRKRVKRVVGDVVGRGGATAEQARALTGDLLAMNVANRRALAKLIRFEVDRALAKVGLATAEEVTELTARVRDLEAQLRVAETRAATGPAPSTAAPTRPSATRPSGTRPSATLPEAGPTKPVAKKAVAKKAVAKKTAKAGAAVPATSSPAGKAVAKKAVAKKAATTRKAQP